MKAIYKITNLINLKVYIGQTKDPSKRLGDHTAGTRGGQAKSLISKAIVKYGWENFSFEVLEYCLSKESADERECFFINFFNSLSSTGHGYNIRGGGNSIFELSQAMKEANSKRMQGVVTVKGKKDFESNFVGVTKARQGKNFICSVMINRKQKSKVFPTEVEAAEAYDKLVLFLYGDLAYINFPEKRALYLSLELDKFFEDFKSHLIPKTSSFKYVSLDKKSEKWYVHKNDRKKKVPSIGLGFFDTEGEAALIADKLNFCFQLNRQYNFPELVESFNLEDLVLFFNSKLITKSSHPGVCPLGSKWKGQIFYKSRAIHLGTFENKEDAISVVAAKKEKIKGFTGSFDECVKLLS